MREIDTRTLQIMLRYEQGHLARLSENNQEMRIMVSYHIRHLATELLYRWKHQVA